MTNAALSCYDREYMDASVTSRMMYRYITSSGEGAFSATRRFIEEQSEEFLHLLQSAVKENADWLFFPTLAEGNLEFYFTEEGKERYEARFLPIQKKCLQEVHRIAVEFENLPGDILYEDPYQIAIRAVHDKSHLPNPYQEPSRYCF